MKRLIFAIPGNEIFAESLRKKIGAETGHAEMRRFPDGETYIRFESEVHGKEALIVCTLDRPDEKFLSVYFLTRALKERGAKKVTLVAPYLAYMRQDTVFQPGELVTSKYFAELLSGFLDELITIDPHLHRRRTMAEIYSIPCKVLHAARSISGYIHQNFPNAVLIGPDSESEQWVANVARDAGIPYAVFEKERKGDREVEITASHLEKYRKFTPIVMDDIVSTARTMMGTLSLLKKAGLSAPICIAVHPVFAGSGYQDLKQAGAKEIISCNTIVHSSNKIDLTDLIAENLK
jgi:ribose-phosphate pyrophosphokinase